MRMTNSSYITFILDELNYSQFRKSAGVEGTDVIIVRSAGMGSIHGDLARRAL